MLNDTDATPKQAFSALGLPCGVRACLFDLDGVLTRTATMHATAWKEMFDRFLQDRAAQGGESFVPFDVDVDYLEHVDGKPRSDGVRSFLASRGIELPTGTDGDRAGSETVSGLSNRKNQIVLGMIRRPGGVEVYDGSVRYVRAARAAGLRTAVVSSSSNCAEVLAAAGIENLFDQRIDAVVAKREQLRGKPAADCFLEGARALSVNPARAAVFEDALAGVGAGRAGGFAYVIGVDRGGQALGLLEHGADAVVSDLADLLDADAVCPAADRRNPP